MNTWKTGNSSFMIFHGWRNFAVNLLIQILLKLALPFHSEKREPALVRTDNWTNFVSGEKELCICIQRWNRQCIHKYLFQQEVHWIFNHPAASHDGGIWDRCIRTTRKIQSALLNEKALNDEGLLTLMCNVETIAKGRPITEVSERTPEIFPLITCFYYDKKPFYHQGPVAQRLVSANRWLRGIKTYRFPWYLTLVSANHALSNPGQVFCKVKITALEGGGARSSIWRINFGNAFSFVPKATEVEKIHA